MVSKLWPALDVETSVSPELVLAAADEFGPTAVEERHGGLRLFFPTPSARDRALSTLASNYDLSAVDIPDEDWARRSQEQLTPVVVGRLTIAPAAHAGPPDASTIVISPSMGFGTGHHETTRLCLAGLQDVEDVLRGRFVLDVGTGSGILALAAAALGAARAVGIDSDADALQNAEENRALNPLLTTACRVEFRLMDVDVATLPAADLVVANLTAASLVRAAASLTASVRPGGTLVASGVLAHERDEVVRAFGRLDVVGERRENEWIAVNFRRPAQV